MNRRAAISVALLGLGFGVCAAVATGLFADPSRVATHETSYVPEGTFLRGLATPAEWRLWNDRGCITCHGPEARGTPQGPDLAKVVPLYIEKFGSVDAAKAQIVKHLIDPQKSTKLREDGALFLEPMPPIERLFGGRRDDAPKLADMLLRLVK